MKHLFLIILVVFAQPLAAQDPFVKIKEKEETFTKLSLNEIRPTGWLSDQLRKDLDGFVGHLDSIVPDLTVKDDIYGTNRRTKDVSHTDVGNGGIFPSLLWWNSETQSNWWDGYIRTAFLLNDPQHIARIKEHVAYILSTQDEDGYMAFTRPASGIISIRKPTIHTL